MNYTIALLPGDGIGPEVMEATVTVLKALEEKTGINFNFKTYMVGDEEKKRSGTALPKVTIEGARALV